MYLQFSLRKTTGRSMTSASGAQGSNGYDYLNTVILEASV